MPDDGSRGQANGGGDAETCAVAAMDATHTGDSRTPESDGSVARPSLHRIDPRAGREHIALRWWSGNSRVWRIAREMLKRIPFARASVRWTLRTFRFHRLYFYLWYFAVPATQRRWRQLCRLSAYAGRPDVSTFALTAAVQVELGGIPVFPSSKGLSLAAPDEKSAFGEVLVAAVENATIHGKTNLIDAGDQVIHHDFYDFEHDSTSEELHGRAIVDAGNSRIRRLDYDAEAVRLPLGAAFVDACAANYAHWLSEVLPRIVLFCGDDRFRDVPVVVDADLHGNILESLYSIVGSDREVITLPVGRSISFDLLYVTGATGYVPFGRRPGKVTGHSHGLFNPVAADAMRKAFREIGVQRPDRGTARRIFLKRNSTGRRLLNSSVIERLLLDRGFHIFEPEKSSFAEQVSMFRWADVVVGATGAACANIVFCRPGTRVGILMGKHRDMPYRYWANMACPLGVDMSYVVGRIEASRSLGIHGDFRVDPDDLIDFLDTVASA